MVCEVLEDTAVTVLIGSGKSRLRYRLAYSEVVALRTMRIQRNNQIPQTYAIGKLAKHHREQLIPTCETLHIAVSSVRADEVVEMVTVKKRDQLRENVFVLKHRGVGWLSPQYTNQVR